MKAAKRLLAVSLCLSMCLSLNSCYTLTVHSNAEVPVSLSESTGTDKETTRHFSRQFNQWYVLGLAPYDTLNIVSSENKNLHAQDFVDDIVREEATGSGGVANLNVVSERNVTSWAWSLLIGLIPLIGPFINGNLSVTVEGDVLEP